VTPVIVRDTATRPLVPESDTIGPKSGISVIHIQDSSDARTSCPSLEKRIRGCLLAIETCYTIIGFTNNRASSVMGTD
jgi:hypothetical protein